MPGLEEVAWGEIQARLEGTSFEATKTLAGKNGLALFRYGGRPAALLKLRTAEDVFFLLARVPKVAGGREGLEEITTRFFTDVGYQGLGSMEYKRDPRDGRLVAVEPTVCRTDWQSAVADCNGVPIPWIAYCDLAGFELPPFQQGRVPCKWVELDSDRCSAEVSRRAGTLGRLEWALSLRPPVRGAWWSFEDPGPSLAIVGARLRGRLARLGRLVGLGRRRR